MRIEQLLAVELDPVRNSDIADRASGPRRADSLHHRLLSADTFQHGVSADAFRQVLYTGHRLVTALNHDIGRAEFEGELLPWRVTAHSNDAPGAHLFGGERAEQTDCAVTDDRNRCARRNVGSSRGE